MKTVLPPKIQVKHEKTAERGVTTRAHFLPPCSWSNPFSIRAGEGGNSLDWRSGVIIALDGGVVASNNNSLFLSLFFARDQKEKTFQLKIPGRENRVVSRWRQLPHCTCERWRGHLKAVITVNSLYFPPPSPPLLSTPLPGRYKSPGKFCFSPFAVQFWPLQFVFFTACAFGRQQNGQCIKICAISYLLWPLRNWKRLSRSIWNEDYTRPFLHSTKFFSLAPNLPLLGAEDSPDPSWVAPRTRVEAVEEKVGLDPKGGRGGWGKARERKRSRVERAAASAAFFKKSERHMDRGKEKTFKRRV